MSEHWSKAILHRFLVLFFLVFCEHLFVPGQQNIASWGTLDLSRGQQRENVAESRATFKFDSNTGEITLNGTSFNPPVILDRVERAALVHPPKSKYDRYAILLAYQKDATAVYLLDLKGRSSSVITTGQRGYDWVHDPSGRYFLLFSRSEEGERVIRIDTATGRTAQGQISKKGNDFLRNSTPYDYYSFSNNPLRLRLQIIQICDPRTSEACKKLGAKAYEKPRRYSAILNVASLTYTIGKEIK